MKFFGMFDVRKFFVPFFELLFGLRYWLGSNNLCIY